MGLFFLAALRWLQQLTNMAKTLVYIANKILGPTQMQITEHGTCVSKELVALLLVVCQKVT